jgi:pimeloyl-ACP methyl ester carboxylesterase
MSLFLLHGLGATGAVWRGFQGVAPDLPGHGSAAWDPPYTFDRHAEAVVRLLPDEPVTVIGHSMGGVVGLVLAAKAPRRVEQVIGLGIKVTWSDQDVARVSALAAKPAMTFSSRDAAADRFLKVSGLAGLVTRDDPLTESAVIADHGTWRLAQDPRTFGVGVPNMAELLRAVSCRVTLARGEYDALVSHHDLAELVPNPVTLPGLGHNAHVEEPRVVIGLAGGNTSH